MTKKWAALGSIQQIVTALHALLVCSVSGQTKVSAPQTYTGMCDASAAVAIDSRLFVVADDEDTRLRVYDGEVPGRPLQIFDLTQKLELDGRSPETDLEGAARVGNTVYWIASHGRNREGKARPDRQRFFATEFKAQKGVVQLALIGKPYKKLLEDLIHAPTLRRFNLAASAALAPKAPGALNIEGLCATPRDELLIGFRNPIPGRRALLVPLQNPAEVLAGRAAKLGDPILLDLGGLGIRDIAFWEGKYLIIAGPFDGSGRTRLFTWAGGTAAPQLLNVNVKRLNAEAIIFYPDKGFNAFQILSDDGTRLAGGVECKELKDESAKRFRSVWVTLSGAGR